MSSNGYGFTCDFYHGQEGRFYHCQVLYKGTGYDDEETLIRATRGWETEDPVALAKYELEHRDWATKAGVVDGLWVDPVRRISVAAIYGGWILGDPYEDLAWHPPTPSEQEVLQIIADGAALDVEHGWDT